MTKKMNIEALREAMSSLGVKPIFKMFNVTYIQKKLILVQ